MRCLYGSMMKKLKRVLTRLVAGVGFLGGMLRVELFCLWVCWQIYRARATRS